jgi:hypothetical protein
MSNFITGKDIRVIGSTNIENCQIIGGDDLDVTAADSNKTNIRNGALVIESTNITIDTGVSITNNNYSIESGVAVSVTAGKKYSYDGASASTWTLNALATYTGIETWIYNRGSDIITLNSSDSPATTIYYNGAAVSTLQILPGEQLTLFGDGDYILAWGIKKPRLFTGATPPTFAETDDIYIAT